MQSPELILSGLDFTNILDLNEEQRTQTQLCLERAGPHFVQCYDVRGIDSERKAHELVALFRYVTYHTIKSDNAIVEDSWKIACERARWFEQRRIQIFHKMFKGLIGLPCYMVTEDWSTVLERALYLPVQRDYLIIYTKLNNGPKSLEEAEDFLGRIAGFILSVISPFALLHHAAAKKQLEAKAKESHRSPFAFIRQRVDVQSIYSHYIIPWTDTIVIDEYQSPKEGLPLLEWRHIYSKYHERLVEQRHVRICLLNVRRLELDFTYGDNFIWYTLYEENSVRMMVGREGDRPVAFKPTGVCIVNEIGMGWIGMRCSYTNELKCSRRMDRVMKRQTESLDLILAQKRR